MKSTVNRTVGARFEDDLCGLLADNGWWAHNMAQNQVGQPADVIAVKNDTPVLIDCKDCENNRFPLSRIEGNQEGAMTLWEERGNAYCYFALRLNDGAIYMVAFDDLLMLELHGTKSLSEKEIREYPSFAQWLFLMEDNP